MMKTVCKVSIQQATKDELHADDLVLILVLFRRINEMRAKKVGP